MSQGTNIVELSPRKIEYIFRPQKTSMSSCCHVHTQLFIELKTNGALMQYEKWTLKK